MHINTISFKKSSCENENLSTYTDGKLRGFSVWIKDYKEFQSLYKRVVSTSISSSHPQDCNISWNTEFKIGK